MQTGSRHPATFGTGCLSIWQNERFAAVSPV